MSRKVQILLAILGLVVGGLLALSSRLPRQSTPPPEPSLPTTVTETPAQRQPRDRYIDEKYGFTIPAPQGWHNETSSILRKQFPDARGVLMATAGNGRRYLEIRVLNAPEGKQPEVSKFLEGAKKAFASAPGQEAKQMAMTTIGGYPGALLTVQTPGLDGATTVRHAWILSPKSQIHLALRDVTGDEAAAQEAFDAVLKGFAWTTSQAVEK